MHQYTMTQAMKHFGMTNTVRLMWVPEDEFGPNRWLDTTTGEVVSAAHEPSMMTITAILLSGTYRCRHYQGHRL